MKSFRVVSAVVVALIATAGWSHAQDDQQPAFRLTTERAQAYVATLSDFDAINKKYADEGVSALGARNNQSFQDALEALRDHPAFNEINATLERHGFSGPDEFLQTADRFTRAYTELDIREQDMDGQMQAMIDEIKRNDMLNDEQKKAMIDALSSQQQAMADYESDVTEGEMEAVESVKEEFEAVVRR